MRLTAQILLVFISLYPVVTSALWIAGGLIFRLRDERNDADEPEGGWPAVTILVPAYNEEEVIGNCVAALRAVDYPALEALVLDDGSTDGTAEAAARAAAGDPRVEVVPDPVNRGKADRLNLGFARAAHELVIVTDADTHLHPRAVKLLVARISRSPRIAAVAGGAPLGPPRATRRLGRREGQRRANLSRRPPETDEVDDSGRIATPLMHPVIAPPRRTDDVDESGRYRP